MTDDATISVNIPARFIHILDEVGKLYGKSREAILATAIDAYLASVAQHDPVTMAKAEAARTAKHGPRKQVP